MLDDFYRGEGIYIYVHDEADFVPLASLESIRGKFSPFFTVANGTGISK